MSNVIDFNQAREKAKFNRLAQQLAENDNSIPELDVDELSINFGLVVARDVLGFLYDQGYDLEENPKTIYDIIMLIESSRSLLYRLHSKEFRLHSIAEEVFEIENPAQELEEILDELLSDD